MITLEWTKLADEQREQIVDFIARDNVTAAVEMDELIESSADSLFYQPEKGRPGKVPGTRELVFHAHYIIVYRYDYDAELISILAVMHTSRQWPQPDLKARGKERQ